MRKVYTGGTFDLFHAGHVELLRRCDELGAVTVGLNTDEFISLFKGQPPVMTYDERKVVLEACRYVDRVIPNLHGANSGPAIETAAPSLIVVGTDWLRKDYLAQLGISAEWLERRGIGLVYLPYSSGISTTLIKKRMADDIEHPLWPRCKECGARDARTRLGGVRCLDCWHGGGFGCENLKMEEIGTVA